MWLEAIASIVLSCFKKEEYSLISQRNFKKKVCVNRGKKKNSLAVMSCDGSCEQLFEVDHTQMEWVRCLSFFWVSFQYFQEELLGMLSYEVTYTSKHTDIIFFLVCVSDVFFRGFLLCLLDFSFLDLCHILEMF